MEVNPTYLPSHSTGVSELASGLNFPEGPAFAPDGSLWFVELHGKSLVHFRNGKLERFDVGGKPNGIAIDRFGKIWYCDAELNMVRHFDPLTKLVKNIVAEVSSEVLANPNDLVFDQSGNLVFSCPGISRKDPSGYVCVRTKDGSVRKIAAEMYFPNGLAFSTDGVHLFIAETYKHRVWKGKWDSNSCEWLDPYVFAETGGPIGPDGLAFDDQGNLHVAVYGAAEIKVLNDLGKLINRIIVPGNNPTNCAYDHFGKLGLVITEAEKGLLLSFTPSEMSEFKI